MEKNLDNSSGIEIIAEVANTHQGDPNYAYQLASKCLSSGANAVKFQIYFANELLSKNHPKYNHFKKQSFSASTWKDIFNSLRCKNKKIYADVFGIEAFNLARNCDLDGFKIHSSDLSNNEILEKINDKKKKYFLSAGGSTIREIHTSLKFLNKKNIQPVLMHGFQAYPTKINDNNLKRILFFKKIFKKRCEVGFQDHTFGGSKMATVIPNLAVSLGAKYIEKHVILKRLKNRIDYYSSFEPNELEKFVSLIKTKKQLNIKKKIKNKIFGSQDFKFSQAELNYRNNFKKVWFSKKKIKKNMIVKKKDLIMKRIHNEKINSIALDNFIKKKSLINIKKETPINKSMVSNDVIALIIVRSASKRLPKKSHLSICGYKTIEHLILRLKQSKKINKIILCTTRKKEDKIFKLISKKHKIDIFFGDNLDVLNRMIGAIKNKKCDLVLRVTGDDILIDPEYLDQSIQFHLKNNLEYSNNKKLPSGMEIEVFDKKLLLDIQKLSVNTKNTEYLSFYINNNIEQIQNGTLNLKKDYRKIRMTLDHYNDFIVIKSFLEKMKINNKLFTYGLNDVVKFYNNNKDLFKINKTKKIKGKKLNTTFDWTKLD